MKIHNLIILAAAMAVFSACDLEHKKKCEWYLMPAPDLKDRAKPGFIPVCARNLTINKEYCHLQATMEFAKEVYGKKFKFSEMKLDKSSGFPRTVVSVETSSCKQDQ